MTLMPWQEIGERELLRYKVFEVVEATRRSPRTGEAHGLFLLKSPDWVNIVALDGDDRLILVRQYRHGTRSMSLELPGGVIDPADESPAVAAIRELREETGYEAESVRAIGVMTPNPAILTNRCHAFLATGCSRVGDLDQDPGEDLEVVLVDAGDIDRWIAEGEIHHALALAAIAMWRAG
ncbi:MAG: NUDIX hydrolase [Planctomycetota bacterium]